MPVDAEEKSQREFTKLGLEVSKLKRERKIKPFTERERFWAETARLVLIVFVTGGVTYFVNEQTEVVRSGNSFDLEEYKTFLTQRTSLFDKAHSFQSRQKLACNITNQYADSDNPEIKKELIDIGEICKTDSTIRQTEALLSKDVPGVENKVPTNYLAKFNKTEREAKEVEQLLKVNAGDEGLKLQQKNLATRLDSLVGQNLEVKELSKQTESVWKNFKEQATIINNESARGASINDRVLAPGYPSSSWFKEKYFLVFDDMKVTLESITGKNEVEISVCGKISNLVCGPSDIISLSSNRLTTNNPIRFERNGFEYVIRLDRIGSAGRNPFTKAAYTTFEKYSLR